jgi:hypothetical protein
MNGGSDPPPFQRWLSFPFVTRDEEQDAITRRDRSLQCTVDRFPGPVEIMTVEIDDSVGLDAAGAKAPVPAAVESGMLVGDGRPGDGTCRADRRYAPLG